MASTIDLPRLTRVLLREASERANTNADSDKPILGGPLDARHKNLAFLVKYQNLEIRADHMGVLQEWLGTKPIIPATFNLSSTLKTDCISRIIGSCNVDVSSRHSALLAKYEDCDDDYAIFKLFNKKFPVQSKTFPTHTWHDDGTVANPDPPLLLRTSPLPAFNPLPLLLPLPGLPPVPPFDDQDPDTWDQLSPADFERAACLYGFYPQHLVTRGFIFDSTLLVAQAPKKALLAITDANPHDEVIKIAQDLNLLSLAQATAEKKRERHQANKKTQDQAFLVLKRFLATAFGADFQDELSSFSLHNDFNGARLHLLATYGKLENSTTVLDHVRGALNDMQTYKSCTSVQGIVNTWETTLTLVIFISHIHLNTPTNLRPSSTSTITKSLYLDETEFLAAHPLTPRLISYRDTMGYFLNPFQASSFSDIVTRWISGRTKYTIAEMKEYLLRTEQTRLLAPPTNNSYSSSSQSFSVYSAPASSDHLDEDERLYTYQVSGFLSPPVTLNSSPSLHPSIPSSSQPSITSSQSTSRQTLIDTSIFYRFPCMLCVNGGSAHPKEKATASFHSLVTCPILPHIARLTKLELNNKKWPSAYQAGAGLNWNLAMQHHNNPSPSTTSSFKRPYSQSSSPSPHQNNTRFLAQNLAPPLSSPPLLLLPSPPTPLNH